MNVGAQNTSRGRVLCGEEEDKEEGEEKASEGAAEEGDFEKIVILQGMSFI